jgi:hypothetical protein
LAAFVSSSRLRTIAEMRFREDRGSYENTFGCGGDGVGGGGGVSRNRVGAAGTRGSRFGEFTAADWKGLHGAIPARGCVGRRGESASGAADEFNQRRGNVRQRQGADGLRRMGGHRKRGQCAIVDSESVGVAYCISELARAAVGGRDRVGLTKIEIALQASDITRIANVLGNFSEILTTICEYDGEFLANTIVKVASFWCSKISSNGGAPYRLDGERF